jgi:hypothetical protein
MQLQGSGGGLRKAPPDQRQSLLQPLLQLPQPFLKLLQSGGAPKGPGRETFGISTQQLLQPSAPLLGSPQQAIEGSGSAGAAPLQSLGRPLELQHPLQLG